MPHSYRYFAYFYCFKILGCDMMEKKEQSIVRWLYFIRDKINEIDERLSEIENALSDEDIDIDEFSFADQFRENELMGDDQLA